MDADNPMVLPVDAEGNTMVHSKQAQRATSKQGFSADDDDSGSDGEGRGPVHIFGGGKGVSGAVVPIGNIDDADVFIETSSKPKMKEKKNSKWGNKGAESLTTETALQFMIKERALMDLETAKLKRENDELRRGLDRGGPSSSAPPPSSSGDGERQTDEQLKQELKRVMHENERLKLRQMTEGVDNASAAIAVPAPPLSMLVQRGPLRGPIGAPVHAPAAAAAAVAGLGLSSYSAGKKSSSHIGPPQQQPSFETDVLTIAARLWDGGYLWKIPYNGKGDPDKRIVALKRAKVYPSPGSRAVIIDRGGVKSKPEHFIVFPPTLVWYNSDKPGEVKNARELILYEGSCLMEGHNTNAFHKLLSRDKSVPRAELCFSMMTSTRSLDLAADRIEDADAWKDALHMLLVELCPNKQWGIENLRRAKPFWNNTLEKPPPAAADNSNKGKGGKGVNSNNDDNNNASQKQLPAAALATGPKAGAKPLRKEAIKKQVFNACKAGDCAMVESMFKAGVPANLVDEKSNSDTPLMVACQIGNKELVELCLQYGAKNDPHPDFGETALHMACRYGHVAAAEVILQAAAQSDADAMICNLTNEEAQTPLHLAAGNGHRAMVDVLLGHGAALDCRDELDQTVLHVASGAGHRDVVATLLDQGGDHLLEYPDLGGSTPLHYAAQNGHLFVIKQLLETAADVTARTMQGQTAYKLAMDRGHTQIATLLLEYMKDYKVSTSLPSGGMVKKSAASTNISRTGRLTIDTVDSHGSGSAHIDEEELLAQGLGYDHHDAAYGDGEGADGEVSLQINSHLPPSPKSAYGTPLKGGGGVAPPPLELPRPHTQSSPVPSAGYRKVHHSPNTSMSTPQKGGGAAGVNGMELSPGNGGYRVLDRSPIQPGGDNRMRASSEGMLPPPHTSPVQTGYSNNAAYGAYVGQGHSPNPGNYSARDGYPPHGAASDMYSPMSARERPAPAIFDGMHMQQQGYAVQSPPPPASGSMIASPIVGYDSYQQQQQQVWNHATQQWEYPPQQQHAQGYPQGYQQQPGLYDPHHHQQYDQQQGYDQHHQQHYQQQPHEWAGTVGAGYDQHQHQQQHYYNDSSGGGDGGGIEEQPSVAVESYEEPEEQFESCGRFWAVYRTEEGHRYFLDSAAEHSQWEDPREVGVLFVDYEAEAAAAEEEEAKFGDGAGIAAVHSSPHRGPGDGAAFLHHNYKLSSPKSSPPKSPSAAGSSRAAAARSFFPAGPSMVAAGDGDVKGDGGIGRSPLVTRLFDDDVGAKQSSSSSSQPQRRMDISPDTSDDEAAAPPEIVIRGSRSRVRRSSSSSGGGNHQQQQQPVSPSRVSAPKNMLPPPISTARDSDEDNYGQDVKSESDCEDDDGATTHTGPSPPAEEKQSSSQSDFKAIDIDVKADASAPVSATDAKSDRSERGRKGGRGSRDRSASRSRSRSRAGDAKSEDLAAPSSSLSMASKLEAIAAARKADKIKDKDKGPRPSVVASNKDESAAAAADVDSAADSKADSGGDRWADSKSGDKEESAKASSGSSSSTAVSDAKPSSSLPDTTPQSKAASAPLVPVQPPSARKAKYVQMLKDGENLRVVRREMEANDEDKGLIREILALADEIAPAPEAAVASSGGCDANAGGAGAAGLSSSVVKEDIADLKQDPVVGKYAKMAGMGIPGPAVAMKMKNEDVPVDQMNRILAALDLPLEASGPAEETPPKEELSDLKQDAVVGKYAKMAAMGVPHASVQAKMRIDAVEQSQQNRILRALGIDAEDGGGGGGGGVPPGPMGALAALAAGPGGRSMPRRPSVPMQTMHWNAIPKDKLEKSIWAASVEGEGDEIQEDDMAEIEKLFGKEEKKPARGAWGDGGAAGAPGGAADEGGAKQPPKKDRLMLIDGKRAQNVTIGLSQFKSLGTFQELLRAVCSLDSLGGRLTIDHLENLQNILPSDSEIKDSARMIESLHPAETFLRTAAQYCPDLPQRLDCFITCSHFGDNCANGLSRARKVITACNEVISSDKLARVLQKMLAVGNIMNQGTFRGNATGFTVDSLLRMINMKGADKKTSVLDYVVKSLYDRGEERVLVVADDLQVVEECVRMSGKEITRALSDLLATFDTLKQESDSVKERRASGEVHSPTPQRSGDGGTSPARQQLASTSQLFSEKLQGRIAEFSSSTEEVAKVRTLMERKVRELVEYFGEDANECDTTSIFSVLQQFRRALHESKAAVERKNKAAARASTGGPTERRSSMA